MSMKNKKVTKNTDAIIYQSCKQNLAKYLVVFVNRGMTSEVHYFSTLRKAKTAFEKIAREHKYKPLEINGSDYYDVSIWEWTKNGYEKIDYYS